MFGTILKLLLAICLAVTLGCGKEEPKKSPERDEGIPIVKKRSGNPYRYEIKNEPDNFRGLEFGSHISEIPNKQKLRFIKDGYGALFEDRSTSDMTLSIAKKGGGMSHDFVRDPEEHRCISCLSQEGIRAKIYSMDGDKLKIGEIPIYYIWYHFYKDRLCTLQISFAGEHWHDVEEIFFGLYGRQVDSLDERIEWHMWEGKRIYVKLWTASRNRLVKNGFIEYCFLPLKREDNEEYQLELTRWGEEKKREKEAEKAKKSEKQQKAKADL
jgi:hypothetical protein